MSDALLAVAEEQLRWLRAAALSRVRETIDAALPKSEMRRAFELCNGNRTGAQLAKAVGVSPQSISNWTKRWRNLGIAYEVEGGAIRHLVSLESLELPMEVE
jgi:Helix-turn-helix domain